MCQHEAVAINPRSITEVERPWLDAMARDHAAAVTELRRQLRTHGVSAQVTMGVVGWLSIKAAGARDEAGQPTRARYRSILRELDCPQFAAA